MNNKVRIEGETVFIEVVRKDGSVHEVVVDKDDLDIVNQVSSIYVEPNGRTIYALFGIKINNRRVKKSIHRLLMNPDAGQVVDHIDGNGLNNRRSNLRICTMAENSQNRISSKYPLPRGVSLFKRTGKYRAQVKIKGKIKHLGSFDDIDSAEKAARLFRQQHMPFSNESRRG